MEVKNKVLYLTSQFKKDFPLPTADAPIDSIFIEGFANTTTVDRAGDIIPKTAWEKGIANYLKNPIVLAYHDHDEPIGRVTEHEISDKGLWVKARISAAADDVFSLIKDGVLTAFSVGFYIKDAIYDAATDLFIIKELELIEISVVAVPANQDSLFDLSKAFGSKEEYNSFKKEFALKDTPAKGLVPSKAVISNQKGIKNMDPKELEALIAEATQKGIEAAKADALEKEKAQAAKLEQEKALEDKVKTIIQSGTSGAEKLVADIQKRMDDAEATNKSALEGLHAAIKEKSAEIAAITKSKMSFSDTQAGADGISYKDKEKAVLLATITGKAIGDTKLGRQLLEKAGAHVPGAVPWEQEVSLNMEDAIRARLVVAPVLRSIDMQTNVMKFPLNPEAGLGTWIDNTSFGTTASSGAAVTHQLSEVTLSAYKVATHEYLAFEEEEDSLIILTPIIRDSMIRRVARAVDRAYLRGLGTAGDPITGLSVYDATSAVTVTNTSAASVATLRSLRKDLGIYGLDPADVVFIVSQEVYYDLLDDTVFQTMNQVGPQATLLTGQIGQIGNSPVLVSAEFATKVGGSSSTNTNIGAIALAPRNFLAGNQRGLRFDTQDLAVEQRKVLVSSLRTGMTQISTSAGMGVSTLRWT